MFQTRKLETWLPLPAVFPVTGSFAEFAPVPFCTTIHSVSKSPLYLARQHLSVLQRSDCSRDLAEIKLTEVFRERTGNVF